MSQGPTTRARVRAAGVLARRLLREPLAQFALGGALLFLLWGAVRDRVPEAGEQMSAGGREVSRTVTVSARDLEVQRAGFRAAWKREPTPAELADLIETFVSEQVLFREGAALGLDEDDAVVRRRLIEKATTLARPSAPVGEPSPDELRRWYEIYQHRFLQPASLTLDQLYFDARKHPDPAAAATAARDQLAARPAGASLTGVGDDFVLPTTLDNRSDTQVAHLFGEEFARAVAAAPLDRWHGPVRSNYGVHLLRVRRRQPARTPPFEEVQKHVRADWLTAHNRGLRAAALALLPRYHLVIEPDVRQAVGNAPALAPFLERAR